MIRRTIATLLLASSLAYATPAAAHHTSGRCPTYEPAMTRHAPVGGWDVNLMSRIAWRESRCLPHVRSTTRDTGLLQINDINLPYLTRTLRTPVTQVWLQNPTNNIRAAAALCIYWKRAVGNCYQPWGM